MQVIAIKCGKQDTLTIFLPRGKGTRKKSGIGTTTTKEANIVLWSVHRERSYFGNLDIPRLEFNKKLNSLRTPNNEEFAAIG